MSAITPQVLRRRLAHPLTASYETAAHHDLTDQQGAAVLLFSAQSKLMLMGLRGLNCNSPHCWAPFGGMMEPGESPLEAAQRELFEEAAVPSHLYTVMDTDPLYTNVDDGTGFRFHTFVAVCSQELMVTINKESLGFAWFNSARLPSNVHPGFQELWQHQETRNKLRILTDTFSAFALQAPR